MQISIIETLWTKTLFGLSKYHDSTLNYGDEIRALLGPVWEAVHKFKVVTTGINHVVYGENGEYFCGLECLKMLEHIPGLIQRRVTLEHYAYYKLTGPYSEIPRIYSEMHAELKRLGFQPTAPTIEIYGHWNDDQTKLETEFLLNFNKLSE